VVSGWTFLVVAAVLAHPDEFIARQQRTTLTEASPPASDGTL
jgi:hypothetical protein